MSLEDFVREINGPEDFGEFDNYKLGKTIGAGGSGKVILVTLGNTKLAMKIPINANPESADTNVEQDSEYNRNYMQEAANWVHVSEQVPDAAVRMLDYNISPFPWAVMELASGDFAKAIEDRTAGVPDVVFLLRSLEDIHRIGIVHRDIKPENILNINGRWKFSDFGLSKSMTSKKLTVMGMGTPAYMAPEQVSRKFGTTDFRTDIWQMGILLCNVLTGHIPFSDDDAATIGLTILTDGPDLTDIPEEYLPVVKKALSIDKSERYASAADFADALEALSKTPVIETPVVQTPVKPVIEVVENAAPVTYEDPFLHGVSLCEGLNGTPDLESAMKVFSSSDDRRCVLAKAYLRYSKDSDELPMKASMMKVGNIADMLKDEDGNVIYFAAMALRLKMQTPPKGFRFLTELRKASNHGSYIAGYLCYINSKKENDLTHLYKAAEAGYSPALVELARYYSNDGKTDYNRPLELLNKAHNNGYRVPDVVYDKKHLIEQARNESLPFALHYLGCEDFSDDGSAQYLYYELYSKIPGYPSDKIMGCLERSVQLGCGDGLIDYLNVKLADSSSMTEVMDTYTQFLDNWEKSEDSAKRILQRIRKNKWKIDSCESAESIYRTFVMPLETYLYPDDVTLTPEFKTEVYEIYRKFDVDISYVVEHLIKNNFCEMSRSSSIKMDEGVVFGLLDLFDNYPSDGKVQEMQESILPTLGNLEKFSLDYDKIRSIYQKYYSKPNDSKDKKGAKDVDFKTELIQVFERYNLDRDVLGGYVFSDKIANLKRYITGIKEVPALKDILDLTIQHMSDPGLDKVLGDMLDVLIDSLLNTNDVVEVRRLIETIIADKRSSIRSKFQKTADSYIKKLCEHDDIDGLRDFAGIMLDNKKIPNASKVMGFLLTRLSELSVRMKSPDAGYITMAKKLLEDVSLEKLDTKIFKNLLLKGDVAGMDSYMRSIRDFELYGYFERQLLNADCISMDSKVQYLRRYFECVGQSVKSSEYDHLTFCVKILEILRDYDIEVKDLGDILIDSNLNNLFYHLSRQSSEGNAEAAYSYAYIMENKPTNHDYREIAKQYRRSYQLGKKDAEADYKRTMKYLPRVQGEHENESFITKVSGSVEFEGRYLIVYDVLGCDKLEDFPGNVDSMTIRFNGTDIIEIRNSDRVYQYKKGLFGHNVRFLEFEILEEQGTKVHYVMYKDNPKVNENMGRFISEFERCWPHVN